MAPQRSSHGRHDLTERETLNHAFYSKVRLVAGFCRCCNVESFRLRPKLNHGKARADLQTVRTHANSGYQYSKIEDEPGYSWMNKKAQDEFTRAWDGMQHKEHMVKREFMQSSISEQPELTIQ